MSLVTEERTADKIWAPSVAKYGEWGDEALQKMCDDLGSWFTPLTPEEGTIFRLDVSEREGAGFDKIHEALCLPKPTEEVVLQDLFDMQKKRMAESTHNPTSEAAKILAEQIAAEKEKESKNE